MIKKKKGKREAEIREKKEKEYNKGAIERI